MGMDIGTSMVHIVIRGKGVVHSEPSYVAFERETRTVISVGDDAMRMYGRMPTGFEVERPFREAHIRSFDLVSKMMSYYLRKVTAKHKGMRPRLYLAMPGGMAPTERQTIIDLAVDSGIRSVVPVDESVASAIGGNVRIDQPYGRMNVDIGGARTNISVFSMGNQVRWRILDFGGDRLDTAICDYMRRKHNLLIGERSAETLKINLGSARVHGTKLEEEAYGRSLISGLPRAVAVTSEEITDALDAPIREFVSLLHRFIEQTPPELASDIFDAGITLSGGGARLYGLDDLLTSQLGIAVKTPDEPDLCVARGLSELLSNPDAYEKINLRSPYRDDEMVD